ncbi:MAG: beta-propeller fold lactonase family protein [Planctomycetes bacterium]|nr:beta-propeller fold lactonase family protein [Planctomycetota bacterium]
MMSLGRNLILFAGVFCALTSFAGNLEAARQDYLSPLALAADSQGKTLYIAEATARQIAVFDIAAGKVKKVIPLPDPPSGLALSPDGQSLYVTGAVPNGRIHVVDLKTGKIGKTLAAEHTPIAPVVSPDGKTLYVCNRFNNNVGIYDLASGEVVGAVAVTREPVAAAVTPDGKLLFVANLVPAGAADRDYVAAEVSVIDTVAKKAAAAIQLPNGSMGLRGVCVSPDGKFAYVTHVLARYQLPTTQLERGWMNTNALSIIDVPSKKLVNTVLLDDVDLGAANPWGVACTADGKYICVTHAGTHQLSVIDKAKLHEKLGKAAAGEKVSDATSSYDDVPNDLSFLVGLRRRLKLTGNGPRGLAVIGTKAYAAEYFTDTLGVVDINPEVRPAAQSLALGPKKRLTARRKGERFFHDANLCFQKWQSCSSCHPAQGRPDALNWDLLNDGLGNPKNTKSMLLAHKTPPAMALGVRDNGEVAVRAGIRHIQFAVRPEADAVAIDRYLKSLKPTPSPYLVNGKLSRSAKRGRKVFEQANCAKCHPAPLYTNLKKYDVGTGRDREKNLEFDTSTLIELWRSAPYLHDGRAVTMKDVLTKDNHDDKHGRTSDLTAEQINNLVQFVLSL